MDPVRPAEALETLLLGTGVSREQIPDSLDARAVFWRDRTAGRNVPLVLDDAQGHEQVRPLLPGLDGSLVLVTSRRRILALDDAARVPLNRLAPDDAPALLVRLAGRSGLDPRDPAIADIARLCDYLPLAISLTAAQLGDHSAWNPADVAVDLSSRVGRAAVIRVENVSVLAALDLSYKRLPADSRRLIA